MSVELDPGTRNWIAKTFGALDDLTASKLVSLKSLFNLSNDDIFIKWESFVVTTQQHGDLDLSPASVEKFQQYLQESIAASHQKKGPSLKRNRDLSAAKRKPALDFSSSPGVVLPSTPHLKKRKPALSSEPDSSPSREALPSSPGNVEAGQAAAEPNSVLECLNPSVEVPEFADTVQLSVNFDAEKFNFRTMAMKLLESADVLDEQIDNFSSLLSETYKNKDISLSNPCLSSQFDIICCGRIVPDSPFFDSTSLAPLNEKSLFLETSRLGGIGQRIPLDLSPLHEYSFFPGQIVGLRGRNPTGRAFMVHEVLELPMLGAPVSSQDELQEFYTTEDHGTKVFVAAGPYSNSQTLNYDKLSSLVNTLNTEIKPQVAIFFGPFLDMTNKAVESGDLHFEGIPQSHQPRNLDEVFKLKITPVLKQVDSSIQVILLPSLSDAVSKHASYPQSPLDRKRLGLPKNFKCFPNPSGFSVNEVMFGTSNLDVFKDLKDVYKAPTTGSKTKISSNRFDRIASHIFEQRRYYPLFPGSVKRAVCSKSDADKMGTLRDGVMGEDLADLDLGGSCLEVPYLGLSELGDCLPDVLIMPSEMKYFAKVVRGVVVINPGQFIRPSKAAAKQDGSYSVLQIRPPNFGQQDGNVDRVDGESTYYHNVYKRCRVDIHKS